MLENLREVLYERRDKLFSDVTCAEAGELNRVRGKTRVAKRIDESAEPSRAEEHNGQ